MPPPTAMPSSYSTASLQPQHCTLGTASSHSIAFLHSNASSRQHCQAPAASALPLPPALPSFPCNT
eukprot:1160379-Pelagomonas_calceolata.AAC.8